ncbi:hypothetical protein [Saccharophagus sp. K07]|uniref:hypothetical protein n=1 Tax=Saccharophagus sp. K07 TaxID=2283636 RepID=UPI00165284D4|nr:hypothetical protein [Saccharophagus sp. K07]
MRDWGGRAMNMKRKMTRYSLTNFIRFLEVVWQERLVKKQTLQQWQEAISEFQNILSLDEVADLRCLDIQHLSSRYVDFLVDNRNSITPWRIYQLKNGLMQGVGDFIAYTINPNEYKRCARLALAKHIYLQKKARVAAAVLPLPAIRASETRVSSGVQ